MAPATQPVQDLRYDDLVGLASHARRKQMQLAAHGARLILAAVAAAGRIPITKRQAIEIPRLRRMADRYQGKAIPIAHLLARFEAQRVLPGIIWKGFARWEQRDGTPVLVVKELSEQ